VGELSAKAANAQAVVAELLPDWEVAPVLGGGALWATLPAPARAFAAHAARAGVLVVTDETFAAAEPPDRALRLPFTAGEEVFRSAIDRVAQAWATFEPDHGDHVGVAGLVV
jgi:DNA-binding transcriptional MocR family regulator